MSAVDRILELERTLEFERSANARCRTELETSVLDLEQRVDVLARRVRELMKELAEATSDGADEGAWLRNTKELESCVRVLARMVGDGE